MLLLYMKNGDCIEVREAMSAMRVEDTLLCFDVDGIVVSAFNPDDVLLYTADPQTASLVREDVCAEEDEESGALT